MINGIKRAWFPLLMLALGVAFIAGYFVVWRDQAAGCTLPVTAIVTSSEAFTVLDDKGEHYEYRIVAEYKVDGENYFYEETTTSPLDVGDSYKLMCNPDDPDEAMTPGRARMMWVAPVIGGAMVAYAVWSTGWFNRRTARGKDGSKAKEGI